MFHPGTSHLREDKWHRFIVDPQYLSAPTSDYNRKKMNKLKWWETAIWDKDRGMLIFWLNLRC